MKFNQSIYAVTAALAAAFSAAAAGPALSPHPDGYMTRGAEMLRHGNTAGAIDQLAHALGDPEALSPDQLQQCRYMLAMAYFQRGDERCMALLADFAARYSASPLAQQALAARADHLFYKGEYGPAAAAFAKVDIRALDPETAAETSMRNAISLLHIGDYAKAEVLLRPLTPRSSDLGEAARFYSAYSLYAQGNTREARSAFEALDRVRLRRSASTGRYTSPGYADPDCYLAQMDYADGLYSEGATRALGALGTGLPEAMATEMKRIAGECLFRTGRPSEAAPLLEEYVAAPGIDPARTALYALGSILYDRHDYRRAVQMFRPAAEGRDAIAQSASLYLGQCEEKEGDLNAAALSYRRAYDMGYDPKVSETALYNYVAVSTRGGREPFGREVEAMEQFVKSFPGSPYAADVEKSLAAAYYREGDYASALRSLDRISSPDAAERLMTLKTLYRLGSAAVAARRGAEAERYLTRAVALRKADPALGAQCALWLGDALYMQKKYERAAAAYREYITAAPSDRNSAIGAYNLASSLYMLRRFAEARPYFEQAARLAGFANRTLRADALTRAADCNYYTGAVTEAESGYTRALEADENSAYARLQRARMYGLKGDNSRKLAELESIISSAAEAETVAAAMLEKGRTLLEMKEPRRAAAAFEALAGKYPSAPESRSALLQAAITYAGMKDDAAAEKTYRAVISRWPSSDEAAAAHQDMRSIAARKGTLREYAEFLKSVPGAPSLDTAQLDTLAFEAAAAALDAEKADEAPMRSYIEQHPFGAHRAEALYMLADYASQKGDHARAAELARTLVESAPDSRHAPAALALMAEEYERRGESPARLVEIYRNLESRGGSAYRAKAYEGLMRHSASTADRRRYAALLAAEPGLSAEKRREAGLYGALAALEAGDTDEGVRTLESLTDNYDDPAGARAAVELAQWRLSKGQAREAARLMEKFTDAGSAQEYWLARGFITLADALAAQGRKSLAAEYLRSLQKNYSGPEPEIADLINQRLKKLK